jgi:hypothetical protein
LDVSQKEFVPDARFEEGFAGIPKESLAHARLIF